MQNLSFCLRGQTLDNQFDEFFWDGKEYLNPGSDRAKKYLKKSDFVYSKGVIWYSAPNIEIRLHYCGWTSINLTPSERDSADRLAPITIVANFKKISLEELRENLWNTPTIIGRNFPATVIEDTFSKIKEVAEKRSKILQLQIFIKFFLKKYIFGEK